MIAACLDSPKQVTVLEDHGLAPGVQLLAK